MSDKPERITGERERNLGMGKITEYNIRWIGGNETWESAEDVKGAFPELIDMYKKKQTANAGPPPGAEYVEITTESGETYNGFMKDGVKCGNGVYTDPDGTSFIGCWEDDALNGLGVFKGEEGEYEGEFQEMLKHGHGTFHYINGDSYTGNWVEDAMSGKGVYTWQEEGMLYDGEWEDNQKHGKGTMKYTKLNAQYDGSWQFDRFHGQGKYTTQEGEYDGTFVEGERHGKAIYRYRGVNQTFQGDYVNNKQQQGHVYSDGKIYQVMYAADGTVAKHEEIPTQLAPPAPPPSTTPGFSQGSSTATAPSGNDKQAELEAEIARLKLENEKLKTGAPAAARGPPPPPPPKKGGPPGAPPPPPPPPKAGLKPGQLAKLSNLNNVKGSLKKAQTNPSTSKPVGKANPADAIMAELANKLKKRGGLVN